MPFISPQNSLLLVLLKISPWKNVISLHNSIMSRVSSLKSLYYQSNFLHLLTSFCTYHSLFVQYTGVPIIDLLLLTTGEH